MTSLLVKSSRPRNPLVAAARFRRAGKHAESGGARRQADRRATRREASSLDLSRASRGEPPPF